MAVPGSEPRAPLLSFHLLRGSPPLVPVSVFVKLTPPSALIRAHPRPLPLAHWPGRTSSWLFGAIQLAPGNTEEWDLSLHCLPHSCLCPPFPSCFSLCLVQSIMLPHLIPTLQAKGSLPRDRPRADSQMEAGPRQTGRQTDMQQVHPDPERPQ